MKPCQKCGGVKEGKGRKYCDPCNEICFDCGSEKKAYTPSGKSLGRCLACRAAKEAKRRLDPEYVRRSQIQQKAKLYSISYEEAEMYHDATHCQNCGREPGSRRLHIDHCHTTGKVRGVLCNGCNIALGGVEDNIETLRGLIKYLEQS